MYKLIKDEFTQTTRIVKRLSDNAYIPMAENNTDYQKYLEWVAEGNEPLPADE